ncbi:MAG: nickel pincer cofactor biosynthesis protein LarB [Chloroflexi bacterium]|nr:nickel pincer cofactor biosynthesis protein LarB [Anaerolineaceae bacterium]NMB89311.1 nickel pincer cofactor biosynthesis protein LarB [Chloroflexota bacterium]
MNREQIRVLLQDVADQTCDVDQALGLLRDMPFEDATVALIDHHRALRTGIPEIIYGAGKTPEQIVMIVERMLASAGHAIVTRASRGAAEAVQQRFPQAHDYAVAHMLAVGEFPPPGPGPFVAVVSAGTSDLGVAEEAALTVELLGTRVERIYDVGVAGVHRLLEQRQRLWQAGCVIAVAGMEGALATVVGGLVDCPTLAVPTSVGYGVSLNGLAALLSMLNSCAPGVSVVNIDNGFGAGVCAHMILRGNRCV